MSRLAAEFGVILSQAFNTVPRRMLLKAATAVVFEGQGFAKGSRIFFEN